MIPCTPPGCFPGRQYFLFTRRLIPPLLLLVLLRWVCCGDESAQPCVQVSRGVNSSSGLQLSSRPLLSFRGVLHDAASYFSDYACTLILARRRRRRSAQTHTIPADAFVRSSTVLQLRPRRPPRLEPKLCVRSALFLCVPISLPADVSPKNSIATEEKKSQTLLLC